MHSRLEKPIIREERAETSLVAFIEFGFPEAIIDKPKSGFLKRKG